MANPWEQSWDTGEGGASRKPWEQAWDVTEGDTPGVASNAVRNVGNRGSTLLGNLIQFAGTAAERGEESLTDLFDGVNPAVMWGSAEDLTSGGYEPDVTFGDFGIDFTMRAQPEDTSTGLFEAGQAVEDVDFGYQPNFTIDRALDDPSLKTVAGAVAEQGPAALADLGALLLTTPGYLASRTEEIAEGRTVNEGGQAGDMPSGGDLVTAAPYAAGSVAIDRLAAGRLLPGSGTPVRTGRDVARETGRAAGREATTEAIQEGGIEYAGETVGTEAGYDPKEAVRRAIGGAIIGGPVGGAVRGTTSAVELRQNVRAELEADGVDPEAYTDADIDALIAETEAASQATVMEPEAVESTIAEQTGTNRPGPLGEGMPRPQARQARREQERELGDVFRQTDVLRRQDVDVQDGDITLREDAQPARDATGEQAAPESYGARSVAQRTATDLGVTLGDRELQLAARDIMADPEADIRQIVRSYSQEARSQAARVAERRRQRREQDLRRETDPERDFRTGAGREQDLSPRMQQELEERARRVPEGVNTGQPGGPRDSVDRISTTQPYGLSGEYVQGDPQGAPAGPASDASGGVDIEGETTQAQAGQQTEPDAEPESQPQATTPRSRESVDTDVAARVDDLSETQRQQVAQDLGYDDARPARLAARLQQEDATRADEALTRAENVSADTTATETDTGAADAQSNTDTTAQADTEPAATPTKTPMPERVYSGLGSFEPKPIRGPLYRETNVEGMGDLLMNTLANVPERGSITPTFVTNDPDIALGQRANKGARVLLDGDLVSGDQNRKPGTDFSGMREYRTNYIGRDAIQGFSLPAGSRMRGAARVFAKRHFDKETVGDLDVYRRKGPADDADLSWVSGRDPAPQAVTEPTAAPVTREVAPGATGAGVDATETATEPDVEAANAQPDTDTATQADTAAQTEAAPESPTEGRTTPTEDATENQTTNAEDSQVSSQFYSGVPLDRLAAAVKRVIGGERDIIVNKMRENGQFIRSLRESVKGNRPHENPVMHIVRTYWQDTDRRLRGVAERMDMPGVARVADAFALESGTGSGTGRMNYHDRLRRKLNLSLKEVEGIRQAFNDAGLNKNPETLTRLRRLLENPSARRTGKLGEVARKIEAYFRKELDYQREAGLTVGEVKGYLPRVIDRGRINGTASKPKFVQAAARAYRIDNPRMSEAEARAAGERRWQRELFGEQNSTPGWRVQAGSPGRADAGKQRVLSQRAVEQSGLQDFMVNDPFQLMVSYAQGVALRGELAKTEVELSDGSTVALGENWENWSTIREDLIQEGGDASYEVMDQVEDLVAVTSGLKARTYHGAAAKGLSWIRTISTMGLLELSTLTSLPEPIITGLRMTTGGSTQGVARDLGNVLASAGRYGGDALRYVARLPKRQRLEATYDLLEGLGEINANNANAMSIDRFAGGDPASALQSELLSSYFRGIRLEQFTNYSATFAAENSMTLMRQLVKDLDAGGKRAANARFHLQDLNVPKAEVDAFAGYVRRLEGRNPTVEELAAGGREGALYSGAVSKFVSDSVMRPSAAQKPAWAASPLGAAIFQLQSFPYSFTKQVLSRPFRVAKNAPEELGKLNAMYTMMPFMTGMAAITGLQAMQGELRDNLTEWVTGEETPEQSVGYRLERALSWAGVFGKLDPIIQTVSGSRYQRSTLESLTGPTVGRLASSAGDALRFITANSPNTNAAEQSLWKTTVDIGIEPTFQAAMSLVPDTGLTGSAALAARVMTPRYLRDNVGESLFPRDKDKQKRFSFAEVLLNMDEDDSRTRSSRGTRRGTGRDRERGNR